MLMENPSTYSEASRRNMDVVYNKELVFTSIAFVSPLYTLSMYHFHVPTWIHTLILLQGCISVVFWIDPVGHRNTLVHRVDAVLARMSISSVIGFKIWVYRRNAVWFYLHLLPMFYCFYVSNVYSQRSWCSRQHIRVHGMAHMFAYASILGAVWGYIVEDI